MTIGALHLWQIMSDVRLKELLEKMLMFALGYERDSSWQDTIRTKGCSGGVRTEALCG